MNKKLYALTNDTVMRLERYARAEASVASNYAADELIPLDRAATVECMAQAIWAHSTGALCGDPLCRYATVDADADYQCQCTDCQGQAESFARAAFDAMFGGNE